MAAAVARGINLRDVGSDRIGISVDETTTEAHLEAVWRAFGLLPAAGPRGCARDPRCALAADERTISRIRSST
jgi:glycine dehydrogenase